MIMIPDREKQLIANYMRQFRCPRTLTGYTVLMKVIYIAIEDPLYADEINCEDIFRTYASKAYEESSSDLWKAPYRAARYCILKSDFEPTGCGRYSIPAFIQDGRDYVANAIKDAELGNVKSNAGSKR